MGLIMLITALVRRFGQRRQRRQRSQARTRQADAPGAR
jgi:hypothetical protein